MNFKHILFKFILSILKLLSSSCITIIIVSVFSCFSEFNKQITIQHDPTHKTLIDPIIWCYQTFSIWFPIIFLIRPGCQMHRKRSYFLAFLSFPFFNLVHRMDWHFPSPFSIVCWPYLLSVNFQLPSIFAKNNQWENRKYEYENCESRCEFILYTYIYII